MTESECKRLSAAGNVERAVECFQELSQGSGVEAEVALYNAARLSADQLSDPRRALRLLDEYQRRFLGGPMRGEVETLRAQSLHRIGRSQEALAVSEALLATPAGRGVSSELHLLRGRILRTCSMTVDGR